MCAQEGINLWGTKKRKNGIIHTNVAAVDFRKIRKIAKKTKCRVRIKRKKGIPFVARKYKNRKVFIFLFFILVVSIIVLSNFIWNIEVVGNNQIPRDELIQELANYGLKQGSLKSKIDVAKIIDEIRLKDNRISWIGIKIEGTNAKIEVAESIQKPYIINENEYCDIVSDKEGIITKINVNKGTAQVKEGDVVEIGQKLISGWMEGQYTGVRYMHAEGNVQAKVWYAEEIEEKYIQEEKVMTQNKENKYGVMINKNTINFYKRLSKFENYDTIETENKFKILNNFYLPIELHKITNYEYKMQQRQYTEEELKEKILSELEEKLKDKIENKETVNKNIVVEKLPDGLKIKLIYEVLEQIGIEQKLIP